MWGLINQKCVKQLLVACKKCQYAQENCHVLCVHAQQYAMNFDKSYTLKIAHACPHTFTQRNSSNLLYMVNNFLIDFMPVCAVYWSNYILKTCNGVKRGLIW